VAGELASSFFRVVPLGILAAGGRLSTEPPKDAADSEDVRAVSPGRRGRVLCPNCADLLGAGEKARLGDAVGVDWLDCPEKRSSHMPALHKYWITEPALPIGEVITRDGEGRTHARPSLLHVGREMNVKAIRSNSKRV